MAIIIAFLGVGVVAIPTGIISAGFVEQYTQKQNSDVRFSDVNDVGEIFIDEKSKFKGMTVGEVAENFNVRILVILRGEMTIVPNELLKLKNNDIIIVKTDKLIKTR